MDVVKSRIYLIIIVVMAVIIAAMAYKFVIAGSALKAGDGRIEVVLEPGERDLMLKEMRTFIESLRFMSDALAREDMKAVAEAARVMGTAKARDVPLAMIGKLPLGFKTLAFGVHRGFDAIARDAEIVGTSKHTLTQLSEVLRKCVACHNDYQLKASVPK